MESSLSYQADTPSGGTIVVLAILVFVAASIGRAVVTRVRAKRHERAEIHAHEHGPECGHPAVPHHGHLDYLHDGHRHAPHEGHYDEHDLAHAADQAATPTTEKAGQP